MNSYKEWTDAGSGNLSQNVEINRSLNFEQFCIKGPFSHKHQEFKVSRDVKETFAQKKKFVVDLKIFFAENFRSKQNLTSLVAEKRPK